MIRFPDTPIMCLRVSDDIDAVFYLNRMIRDSLARNLSQFKHVSVGRAVFSHAIFTFQNSYGRNCPLHNDFILNVCIKVYIRSLYQCWFLKKDVLEGSNCLFYPPG